MKTIRTHHVTCVAILLAGWAGVASAQDDAEAKAETRTRNVAIVVHEGVELLDFAGPGEVFKAASMHGRREGPAAFNVYTVAPSDESILSQGFVTVTPEYSIESCPKPDIIVIPGGATGVLTEDEAFMTWVEELAEDTEIMFSVCTGAFVYAELGLLDGLNATTWWGQIEGLRKAAPKAKVIENVRYVDNGQMVTTAGVSAGIDGALHVVDRLLGREAATATAKYMEYRWLPEGVDSVAEAAAADDYPLKTCVVSGIQLDAAENTVVLIEREGREIRLCCTMCVEAFDKDPDAFLAKLDEAAKTEK